MKLGRLRPSCSSEQEIGSVTVEDKLLQNFAENISEQYSNSDVFMDKNYFKHIDSLGEKETDKLQLLTISVSLFNSIMPALEELTYLSHVREVSLIDKAKNNNSKTSDREKYSILFSNRLPPVNGKCYVHLVSIENMGQYLPDINGASSGNIPYQYKKIALVTLKNWEFTSYETHTEKRINIADAIEQLDKDSFKLPEIKSYKPQEAKYISQINQSRALGYTALEHKLRNGNNSLAWYRGPFSPYQVEYNISWPNETSDKLLRFDPTQGMFDVSYAAAWQLGRLLAISDKNFASNLYSWKKQKEQITIEEVQRSLVPGLIAKQLEQEEVGKSTLGEDIFKELISDLSIKEKGEK